MTTINTRSLKDGDRFTTDGKTWHTAAVLGFGTVSCYAAPEKPRTARSMTYRVPVGDTVTVNA